MVLMAGMLPGVECARRRRRIRQGGSSSSGAAAEAPCGTRRPSFCLYAGGHDLGSSSCLYAGGHDLGSSSSGSNERSKETTRARTLDSNAREAKERLDQKLRSQRQSVVVNRHQSTGSARPPATKPHADGGSSNHSAPAAALPEDAPTTGVLLQREVLSKNGAGRRRFSWSGFSWSRLGRRRPAEAEVSECAVCLEELRAGDVLVHLPCAHRFHWACAVPWVQAASLCPVCRAGVHLASDPQAN